MLPAFGSSRRTEKALVAASSLENQPSSPRNRPSMQPAGFVHRFPHFFTHGLIPQTAFLPETEPSLRKRGSMHHFPQFPPLQTTHYHDCAQCRRPYACVCQTPRNKILCLECWEETQRGFPMEETSCGRDVATSRPGPRLVSQKEAPRGTVFLPTKPVASWAIPKNG